MKKLLALLLSVLITFAFTSCSTVVVENDEYKDEFKDEESVLVEDTADDYVNGILLYNTDEEEHVELGRPDRTLDPQQIYSNITYIPEMFYGTYRVYNVEETRQKMAEELDCIEYKANGEDVVISILPYSVSAGFAETNHIVSKIEGYDWMKLSYMCWYSEDYCGLNEVYCAYTIDGNTITLNPIESWEYDEATKTISYSMTDTTWQYEFEFSGRKLVLSYGDESVELYSGLGLTADYTYLSADCYVSPGSKRIDNIEGINFAYDCEEDEPYMCLYFEPENGTIVRNSVALIEDNGLITFTVPYGESLKTYQYVYFYCGDEGLVLTDGDNIYYYNDDSWERNYNQVDVYFSEEQAHIAQEMSETDLQMVVEKKENLIDDLVKAFEEAGINVVVDEKNGEIAMDSSVLFGGDSAQLTQEGQQLLDKFVNAYTSIVFSEKYVGFVSKTMVEGHTAPVGNSSYEDGYPLSFERANVVRDYCVSVGTSELSDSLEAVGYSNSKPITDDDGNVDMAASRRVSFRFIINLEYNR